VTGWQVEIHLRIPLDDTHGNHPRQKRTAKRTGSGTKVSSEDGLRSLRHPRRRVLPPPTETRPRRRRHHPQNPPAPTTPLTPGDKPAIITPPTQETPAQWSHHTGQRAVPSRWPTTAGLAAARPP
jgi:hypothetical protein